MDNLLFVLVLVLIAPPITGIVAYVKMRGMLRDSLLNMHFEMDKVNKSVGEMTKILRDLSVNSTVSSLKETAQPAESAHIPEVVTAAVEKPVEDFVKESIDPTPESGDVVSPHIEPVNVQEMIKSNSLFQIDKSDCDALTHETVSKPEVESVPQSKPYVAEKSDSVFSRIWSWIVVGEEHRNPNVSMEYAVASTWLLRIGIIALVICVGYFLRWSIDKGILGPAGRVALSVLAGVAMLVAGQLNIGKKYHLLGQGFLGGGLAFLYFAMYAAGPMYSLVGSPVAFGLMCIVTLTAGVLAIRTDSQLIAILGIIGGFATPVMLHSAQPDFIVLYSYLLLLGIGILGISHVKQWRLLNYLGFVFTWGLFIASLGSYHYKEHFAIAIVFLSLLFILHSAIVYYYSLVQKKASTIFEICHLLINGILFAFIGYNLILEACGRPWPAVMTIALSIFYIVHIFIFLKSHSSDKPMIVVLIALGGFFTALSVPFITERETLTICWALLAFSFLWVGRKLDSKMLTAMSTLLYCIVLGRIVFMDIPRNFLEPDWTTIPIAAYWKGFADRLLTFGITIVSVFGAYWLCRKDIGISAGQTLDESKSFVANVRYKYVGHSAFWLGILVLFAVIHLEFYGLLNYFVLMRPPVLTLLWVSLGILLLSHYNRKGKQIFFIACVIVAFIALFKLFIVDFGSWGYRSGGMVYNDEPIEVLMRFIDFGAIFGLIVLILRSAKVQREPVDFYAVFNIAGTALLVTWTTLETNTFFHWHIPDFQAGAVSVLWALFAIALIIFGIWKVKKAWRYTGLIFFCVVICKVFLFDLAGMETIYRVIAFLLVGGLLIAGSTVYIKAGKKFMTNNKEKS